MAQIICLVHGDLHDESDLAALHYVSTTVISHRERAVTGALRKPGFSGKCEVTHKRKSGKVIKTVCECDAHSLPLEHAVRVVFGRI